MFKALLTSVFLSVSIYANGFDYAKAYLYEGVEAMEKLAENQLEKEDFWLSQLSDHNVTFGYYQNKKYSNFVIVDKSQPRIEVYDSNFTQLLSEPAVIGEILGDKMVEGDLKTPIGVYKFTKRIQHVDPFYGPIAIVTDYPNFYDKMHKKTGSGIWLHGFPLDEPFKNKTEGCVAVNNELLLKIDSLIDHKNSLLITNEKGKITATKEEIAKVLSFIYRWRNAWKYDDYETYLSMYDKQFQWYNKMDKDRFAKYKQRIFKIASQKEIVFKDIEVIPYPTSLYNEKVYKVSMHQDYTASNHRSSGRKTLYVKLNETTPSIVLER